MIWSFLYIGYTIAFGIRLRSWNDDKPGQCFIASGISSSGASHPYVDNIYISITCLFVISSLFAALGFNDAAFNHENYSERVVSAMRKGVRQLETLGLESDIMALPGLGLAYPRIVVPVFAEDPDGRQISALFIAFLQYPVHIYSIYALRAANESHLTHGNIEQDWGFGQVVAVALLGSNIVMVVDSIWSTCSVV